MVEVADTSGEDDRQRKLPAYARAGIPQAWLVDLPHDVIEGSRGPGAEGYQVVQTFKRGDELVALAVPVVSMSVEQVLG